MAGTSKQGLVGAAQFQCTGLPAGISCVFSPSQVTLPADGTATTSLIIASTQNAGSVLLLLLLLPAGLRSCRSRRVALIGRIAAGGIAISGCGGDSADGKAPQPAVVSFVVDATVGDITRSTPITVTLD